MDEMSLEIMALLLNYYVQIEIITIAFFRDIKKCHLKVCHNCHGFCVSTIIIIDLMQISLFTLLATVTQHIMKSLDFYTMSSKIVSLIEI